MPPPTQSEFRVSPRPTGLTSFMPQRARFSKTQNSKLKTQNFRSNALLANVMRIFTMADELWTVGFHAVISVLESDQPVDALLLQQDRRDARM